MADDRPLPALESDGAHQLAPATTAVVADVPDAISSASTAPADTEVPAPPEDPEAFHAWLKEWFDRPETRKLLVGKIENDLKNRRGPGTFALKLLAHAYGEPRQMLDVAVRAAAQKVADETGIPIGDLLAKAAELAAAAGVN
jgi:hypothetical protein